MSYGVENYELSQEKLYVNVISPKRRTNTEKKINGTNSICPIFFLIPNIILTPE